MENKKGMDLNDFVSLMLVTLAIDSKIIDILNKNKKIVSFPSQYKQIIENILYMDNGWKEEFSVLIDIEKYFADHFRWELEFSNAFEKVLLDLGKDIQYDFLTDDLLISFTQKEIDMIKNKYQDETLNNIMNHFTNLLVNCRYTRKYQEYFYDFNKDFVRKRQIIKK